MKVLKLIVIAIFAAALTAAIAVPTRTAQSQAEAPAGFDNESNGFTDQTTFNADRAAFEERGEIEEGLGPVYNAQSCPECHQNPVTGGISQIFELRAGHSGPDGNFVNPPGGSLIQARATDAQIQERVPDGSRLVFRGPSVQISVMGFDGGQYGPVGNTPITTGFQPSWSPDGKQIVFARRTNTGNNTTIRVMNDDGTTSTQRQTPRTPTGTAASARTWKPSRASCDGRWDRGDEWRDDAQHGQDCPALGPEDARPPNARRRFEQRADEQRRAAIHDERGDTAPRRTGHGQQNRLPGADAAPKGATVQIPQIPLRGRSPEVAALRLRSFAWCLSDITENPRKGAKPRKGAQASPAAESIYARP